MSATAATQKMGVCYTSVTASATAATNYSQLLFVTSGALAPRGGGSIASCRRLLNELLATRATPRSPAPSLANWWSLLRDLQMTHW